MIEYRRSGGVKMFEKVLQFFYNVQTIREKLESK